MNQRRQRTMLRHLRREEYSIAYGFDEFGIHPRTAGLVAQDKRREKKESLRYAKGKGARAIAEQQAAKKEAKNG